MSKDRDDIWTRLRVSHHFSSTFTKVFILLIQRMMVEARLLINKHLFCPWFELTGIGLSHLQERHQTVCGVVYAAWCPYGWWCASVAWDEWDAGVQLHSQAGCSRISTCSGSAAPQSISKPQIAWGEGSRPASSCLPQPRPSLGPALCALAVCQPALLLQTRKHSNTFTHFLQPNLCNTVYSLQSYASALLPQTLWLSTQ